jgi:hypothetical protein
MNMAPPISELHIIEKARTITKIVKQPALASRVLGLGTGTRDFTMA